MTELILYQWPGTPTIESIYPRAVMFHRICNLASQEITVLNVTLPKPGEKFKAELQNRLAHLPILEVNGQKFSTSKQIMDYFLAHPPSMEVKQRLMKMDSIYGHITQQWANECFINSLLYARWKREENYQRFIKTVKWGYPVDQIGDHLEILRSAVLKFIDRTPAGALTRTEYEDMIRNQFWSLDTILSEQHFFEPLSKHPTITDLYVFMVVQGFMDYELEESQWIMERYKNVLRWYNQVDRLSLKSSPF